MIFNTKTRIAALLLAGSMVAVPLLVSAQPQVPNELIYEGRMLSKSGQVLTESYVLRFSFWKTGDYISTDVTGTGSIDASSGNYAGWTEVLPVTFNDLGHFSVVLGDSSSLENLNFDTYKYLQVEIKKSSEPDSAYQLLDIDGDGGANTNDRKLVASVPYARHSELSGGAEGSTFVIDSGNTIQNAGSGNISLQFGGDLQEFLHYDIEKERFILTGDLEIQNNLITTGLVDGVDVSELANQVAQNTSDILTNAANIAQNAGDITEAQADIIQNAADILSNAIAITAFQAEIIKNATDILINANAITAAQAEIINNTTTIAENTQNISEVTTVLETLTVGSNGGQIAEETVVIDTDDTGGNLTLQFGNTLNETLMWNTDTEQFELSDDLLVNGNIEVTGTVDGVDISDLSDSVATNSTNIAGNTSNIVTNTTAISEAEADILQNAADILRNTTDIANLDTRLTAAESSIVQNAADILGNAAVITQNTDNIDVLNTQVSENTLNISEAQQDIINNAADILENKTNITQAQQDILDNAAKITQNIADITELQNDMQEAEQDILNNASQILTNTTNVTDLSDRLTTAENSIVLNAADILANANDILENSDKIDVNISDILANKNAITQAQADIINNAANIASNKTNISEAEQDILDNAAKITQNAADIVDLSGEVALNKDSIADNSNEINSLESDINDINNLVGDGNFSGANYISFGTTLTKAVLQLDNQIKNNEDFITTNANNIAGNTSVIADLTAGASDLETKINLNKDAITVVSDKVGDLQYDSENVITSGEDVTTSLSKLDEYVTSSKGNYHQVYIGTASLHQDGTDNSVNIYQALEPNGTNTRHFYKIVSSQLTLQDMDMQFKVQMPNDLDEFGGFTISYETEGDVTESKLDISVTDHNGNIAGAEQNLSSNLWTEFSPNINAAFNPQAGEYIYISLKPYTKEENAVRVGDISLQYTTHK